MATKMATCPGIASLSTVDDRFDNIKLGSSDLAMTSPGRSRTSQTVRDRQAVHDRREEACPSRRRSQPGLWLGLEAPDRAAARGAVAVAAANDVRTRDAVATAVPVMTAMAVVAVGIGGGRHAAQRKQGDGGRQHNGLHDGAPSSG